MMIFDYDNFFLTDAWHSKKKKYTEWNVYQNIFPKTQYFYSHYFFFTNLKIHYLHFNLFVSMTELINYIVKIWKLW